jgi:hypothetical protein
MPFVLADFVLAELRVGRIAIGLVGADRRSANTNHGPAADQRAARKIPQARNAFCELLLTGRRPIVDDNQRLLNFSAGKQQLAKAALACWIPSAARADAAPTRDIAP